MIRKLNIFSNSKHSIGYVGQHKNLTNIKNHCVYDRVARSLELTSALNIISKESNLFRGYCTIQQPAHPNVFGDIGGCKYDRVEMDENEREEEEYEENIAKPPRRMRPSPGQYATMIKNHVSKKDLTSALKILDLVKENRDVPTPYMYRLLITAFARQGDVKASFHLYNDMKKRQLKPSLAIYTSLINACAECKSSKIGLEKLKYLRHSLDQHDLPLNDAHYNAMVKAYSLHNQVLDAFQLVDEMRDKKLPITEYTYHCLFHGAISDKEAGVRHALIIWHLMRYHRVKPSIYTYNLFLRAIRDTNIGNIKVNDVLVKGMDLQICPSKEGRPDLLANPPLVSNLIITCQAEDYERSKTIQSLEKQDFSNINLKEIFSKNRLILFGGFENILRRMDNDNVTPDIKTFTLLLETLPDSIPLEEALVKNAESRNVKLDVDFYNMLIKKRNRRNDYKAAREVVREMQKYHLRPNIMTFGVLAIGCFNPERGFQLLKAIEDTGFVPNKVIVGTLILNACQAKNAQYVMALMKYMNLHSIAPDDKIFTILDKYQDFISQLIKEKDRIARQKDFQEEFEIFKIFYANWQRKWKREHNVVKPKQYK